MWESILFSLQLAFNANEASKEMQQRWQEQNRCLLAKECEAIYDNDRQGWIVRKRENFHADGVKYNIADCLCLNTCRYDKEKRDYLGEPDYSKRRPDGYRSADAQCLRFENTEELDNCLDSKNCRFEWDTTQKSWNYRTGP